VPCYTEQVFPRSQIPEIAPAAVDDDAFLLDVRDQDEWTAGHATDAHHVPMMEIPVRLAEVPTDRDVVVICRVGGRSAQVVAYLRGQGWERVANLEGGMFAWHAAGRPMESDDGQPARVL
jgi:rhodanese-related sulfurtransferase